MLAFVDESIRGSTYLMCAVLVTPRDVATIRRELIKLRLRGQERIHLKKESPSRKRIVLDRVAKMPVRAHLYIAAGDRLPSRIACIRALVADLVKQHVTRLIVEPVDGLVPHDQLVVRRALYRTPSPLVLEHVQPKAEPALWAADAIAWAYGAKGDWQRRINRLVETTIDLRKREARIMSVRTSSGLTS